MRRKLWKSAIAASLIGSSLWVAGSTQAGIFFNRSKPKPAPTAATPAPDAQDDQTITLRQPGQAERKCRIEKSVPQPDGTVIQHLRAIDTGEHMTIVTGQKTARTAEPPLSKPHANALPIAADRKSDPLYPPGYDSKPSRYLSTAASAAKAPPSSAVPAPNLDENSSPVRSRLREWFGRSPEPVPATAPVEEFKLPPPTPPKFGAMPVSLPKPPQQVERKSPSDTVAPQQGQLIIQLVEGASAADREAAANALTNENASMEGDIVGIMVHVMRNDESPSVRAACVRNLSRRASTDPTFAAGLESMRGDTDKHVQREVAAARAKLGVK